DVCAGRHAQAEARVGEGSLRVVRELAGVDPHLALEGGAVGLEQADDLPAAAPELKLVPELRAPVAPRDAAPHDRLARRGLETVPPASAPVSVYLQGRPRLDAPHQHVLAAAVLAPE